MRVNANKKVHKVKRDPYKTLLRVAGVLAVVVGVGAAAIYLCSTAVTNDYVTKRDQLAAQNQQDEADFNARMDALRAENNADLEIANPNLNADSMEQWETTMAGKVWRIEDQSHTGLENTSTVTLNRTDVMNGGLLLVNAWHMLPTDFSDSALVNVAATTGYTVPVDDNGIRLFPAACSALQEALAAAKDEAGLDSFLVLEGYRSNETQSTLFNKQMEQYSGRYSGDRLIEETKKRVNYPGTSDYQTGLTFRVRAYSGTDAALNNKKFQGETEQGKWLTENCWRFGIEFRFPTVDFPNASWEDKSFKTGVSSALNMYRYVGKAHAAVMRARGMCLEEYIEFLMEHPHICVYEDGALRYEIVRVKVADDATSYSLPVPNPASSYQASLDNMGGVVMAYTYY